MEHLQPVTGNARVTVRDFPALVLIDSRGNDLYAIGPERYRENVDI